MIISTTMLKEAFGLDEETIFLTPIDSDGKMILYPVTMLATGYPFNESDESPPFGEIQALHGWSA